jgi:large subunit ribosomal protein L3
MTIGLVGRKVGMTRIFTDDGGTLPVTVLDVSDNRITQIKTSDNDGYAAVQVAFGKRRASRVRKPLAGHLAKAAVEAGHTLREFRLAKAEELANFKVGGKIGVELFKVGQLVDVSGVTIGKGFAGVIKRHNFHRGPKTHGSDHHRAPGSIGPGTTPGRVYRGLKMSGHMGDERVTIKKVRVVRTDTDRNLLLVNGSLPGARGSLILVKKA